MRESRAQTGRVPRGRIPGEQTAERAGLIALAIGPDATARESSGTVVAQPTWRGTIHEASRASSG